MQYIPEAFSTDQRFWRSRQTCPRPKAVDPASSTVRICTVTAPRYPRLGGYRWWPACRYRSPQYKCLRISAQPFLVAVDLLHDSCWHFRTSADVASLQAQDYSGGCCPNLFASTCKNSLPGASLLQASTTIRDVYYFTDANKIQVSLSRWLNG